MKEANGQRDRTKKAGDEPRKNMLLRPVRRKLPTNYSYYYGARSVGEPKEPARNPDRLRPQNVVCGPPQRMQPTKRSGTHENNGLYDSQYNSPPQKQTPQPNYWSCSRAAKRGHTALLLQRERRPPNQPAVSQWPEAAI